MLHFFMEFGSGITGSQYTMQSVLSDHFENRIINLGTQGDDFMMMADIRTVEGVEAFANFTTEMLYPLDRRVIDKNVLQQPEQISRDEPEIAKSADELLMEAIQKAQQT